MSLASYHGAYTTRSLASHILDRCSINSSEPSLNDLTQILPTLLPFRVNRNIVPAVLGLCVPIVVFLVIGRTVEIHKEKRSLLENGAGAGVSKCTLGFANQPHSSPYSHLTSIPCRSTPPLTGIIDLHFPSPASLHLPACSLWPYPSRWFPTTSSILAGLRPLACSLNCHLKQESMLLVFSCARSYSARLACGSSEAETL